MIDPKGELFKWGPIDGRNIYVDQFTLGFLEFPNYIDGSWPDIVGYLHNDTVFYVIDYPDLRKSGEHIFKKYILDEKNLKKYYKQWLGTVEQLKQMEKTVNNGIDKLTELYDEWYQIIIDFWMAGFLPELSNWGAEGILKKRIMKDHKDDFIEIFEALSAPEDYSFFQKEELKLMKIKLIQKKEEQLKKLEKHQKEYYWLRNSYAFVKILDIDFFKKEIDNLSVEDANNKIKEIENYIKDVKKKKKEIIKKYKIDHEIVNIAEKLAYCIWWQDYRKQFIFIANHIINKFLKTIGKEKKIPLKELYHYSLTEIRGLLRNNKRIDVKERFNGLSMYYHEKGKVDYIEGSKAKDLIKPYIEVEVANVKEIKGLVVSKGDIVKAKVKILLTPRNVDKMDKGDILVAPMTSPDFIVAMRKASAIITDEGGMTCHAAIVSRELKIPCIVATKIATKALKDGDIVEVDTKQGVIRK